MEIRVETSMGKDLWGHRPLYVHIGGDVVIALSELVAIIDAATMEKNEFNVQAIQLWDERGYLHKVTDGPVNSWIVTTHKVYASPIAAATLHKRAENFDGGVSIGRKQTKRV